MSRRSHRERHRPDRYGDWDLRSKSSSTASSTSSIRRRKAQLELEAAEQLAQLGQREINLQRQLIQKRLELAQEELDEATRLPLPPSESASTQSQLSDERLNEWIADQQLQPTEQQPTGGEQPIGKVETPRQVDLDLQTAQPELVHVASQDLPDRHQSAILDGMATTVAIDNLAALATTSRSTAIDRDIATADVGASGPRRPRLVDISSTAPPPPPAALLQNTTTLAWTSAAPAAPAPLQNAATPWAPLPYPRPSETLRSAPAPPPAMPATATSPATRQIAGEACMHTHTAKYTHPTVIKLKPIEVPKFSGENTEYFQWKQRFMCLVEQDSSPDLVKLTRFREALEGGTAHQIASGIMDGPGAYQAIWAELDLWYGGEHRFLEQQEREIMSFTPITSDQDVHRLQQFTLLLRNLLLNTSMAGIQTGRELYLCATQKIPCTLLVKYVETHDDTACDIHSSLHG